MVHATEPEPDLELLIAMQAPRSSLVVRAAKAGNWCPGAHCKELDRCQ